MAGACLVFAIFIGGLAFGIFTSGGRGGEPANIWSECREQSANVFIGANGNGLQNVRCVALDRELFAEPEIAIGDMSKNDEDVCRFKLKGNTTEPLRFEVHYNGKTKREVCNWQNSFVGGGID